MGRGSWVGGAGRRGVAGHVRLLRRVGGGVLVGCMHAKCRRVAKGSV